MGQSPQFGIVSTLDRQNATLPCQPSLALHRSPEYNAPIFRLPDGGRMAEAIRISDLFRNGALTLTNRLRLLRRRKMDYVILRVRGPFPERTRQPRHRFPLSLLPWPPAPPSVDAFCDALDRLSVDPRVKGVVLLISELSGRPAALSSVRQAVSRFRASGKEVVAYLHDLKMWPYYLASSCDRIMAPQSASFHAAGLWAETLFLKDTLALAGIEADFETIAEYKVAVDPLRRAEMTEHHREMLESLLDSIYAEVIGAVAEGRDMTMESVSALLDRVPLTAVQAKQAGLLDEVCYEDELPAHLGTAQAPVALAGWDQAQKYLINRRRWRSRRAIGIISLEGLIVIGSSRRPPLPLPLPLPLASPQAGSDTITQQLRAVRRNKRLAALLLHVDSPGGSALASDLIWREIALLRRFKPVVVYMGSQAASGGYYVSAPANAIFAQPTTLTGSIGIFTGKIVTAGLYGKLHVGREVVSRGKAAGLYSDAAPFTADERNRIRDEIGASYARFKARVVEGRGMQEEDVEAIARGRAWTGEQALDRKLVDQLGDLRAAADHARALAGLDPRRHAPLVAVSEPKGYQLPIPLPSEAGEWLAGLTALFQEGILALAPWEVRFRD